MPVLPEQRVEPLVGVVTWVDGSTPVSFPSHDVRRTRLRFGHKLVTYSTMVNVFKICSKTVSWVVEMGQRWIRSSLSPNGTRTSSLMGETTERTSAPRRPATVIGSAVT